ncbi:MAG TPA: ROK family protein [Niabella sp.]|nr:ROK family protein [Chitinophagaceae bacterium]HRO83440.1 ROK family protein [Niabella sp.]
MSGTEQPKQYVIGIDMGGTNTKFGIVDARGNVLSQGGIKTSNPDINGYMEELKSGLNVLINGVGGIKKIKAIGAGCPNGNYYTGNIEFAPNLPWKGVVPFAKMLSDTFGVPAAITNDANAAAVGEMTYGAAKGMKDFIMITLGTGVGSGIVIDGKIVYGHDGFAGELGHTIIVRGENGRVCGCGRKGCLETYTSATGVARTAREFLQDSDRPSVLRNISPENITSKDVFDAAMQNDELAKDVFQITGKILGEAMADFVAFSAPEAIILFGGLTKAGDLILKPVVESMEENLLSIWKGKVKVIFSELKESDAAILGASALGWEL